MTVIRITTEGLPAETDPNGDAPAFWQFQGKSVHGRVVVGTKEPLGLFIQAGTVPGSATWQDSVAINLRSPDRISTGIVVSAPHELGTRVRVMQSGPAELSDISLTRSRVRVDFGPDVSVDVSKEAEGLLSQAPWLALQALLRVIRGWVSKAPVKAARVRVLREPEDLTWAELAVELKLDVESDEVAFGQWQDLGDKVDKAKAGLAPEDRTWFEKHFAVHLYWGADPWDDD
jgi:hypothetical protein